VIETCQAAFTPGNNQQQLLQQHQQPGNLV
jgi:hypothetical protein